MGSLVTIRMLTLRDIKVLHLEPTDVCQAACPLCARETDHKFDPAQRHHLDMYKITQVFDKERIAQLDKMFMCGVYGDPAAGKYTLDIYQEFRKINPNIVLGMNSNGAVQSTIWWHELGRIFAGPLDYVVFSIDGLEDTNGIYRRGVDWRKLMQNAQAFIAAGGSAHWDMLVYRHNQHQVEECEQLARDMEFTWFRAKVSRRGFDSVLQTPTGWTLPQSSKGAVSCHALNEQSMYIDAQGIVRPCCWLTKGAVDFDAVQTSWASATPNPVCQATCGTNDQVTAFKNQWQREIALV